MSHALHALRPTLLAGIDLLAGAGLLVLVDSLVGLLLLAVGLLVVSHSAYTGFDRVRSVLSRARAT